MRTIPPDKLTDKTDLNKASQKSPELLGNTTLRAQRKRDMLSFFRNNEPAWKEQDHPELTKWDRPLGKGDSPPE
jgi:hypothetical protein